MSIRKIHRQEKIDRILLMLLFVIPVGFLLIVIIALIVKFIKYGLPQIFT
jgi:hypothetical protein